MCRCSYSSPGLDLRQKQLLASAFLVRPSPQTTHIGQGYQRRRDAFLRAHAEMERSAKMLHSQSASICLDPLWPG